MTVSNSAKGTKMAAIITLDKPDTKGTMTLEQAIATRRSRRHFLSESLSLTQIGQLCWSAQGFTSGRGYRATPSAGATYPLELFMVSDDGLFYYLSVKHQLERLRDEDMRSRLASAAWGQEFIEDAPITLVFTAEFSRTTQRYGQRGIRYVYMEAGHAAENIHLQAEALGLGSVAVGAFDDDSVSKVLSLPEQFAPVYMVVVGKCGS
jgi:SagB-type dehydrogenase family enzyme